MLFCVSAATPASSSNTAVSSFASSHNLWQTGKGVPGTQGRGSWKVTAEEPMISVVSPPETQGGVQTAGVGGSTTPGTGWGAPL